MNTQRSKDTQPRHPQRGHQVEPPVRRETRLALPPLCRPTRDLYGHQLAHQSSDQNTHHRAHHPEHGILAKPGAQEAVIPHQPHDHHRGIIRSHREDDLNDHRQAFYLCQLAGSEDLIDDMTFMRHRAEYCLHNHQGRTQHTSANCTKRTLDKLAQRYHAREAANNRHSVPWADWMTDVDFVSSRILYCMRHHRHETRQAGQECGLAIEAELAQRRSTRQEAEQSSHGAARAAVGAISEPVRLYREALVQREKDNQEELQAANTNARTASRAAQSAAVDAQEQNYRHNVHKLRREAQHRAEEHHRQFSINMPPTADMYLDEDFEKLCKEEAELRRTLVRSIDTVYNARSNHAPPEQHEKAKQASRPLASAGDAPPTRLRSLEHVPDVHDVRVFAQVVGPRTADRPAPRAAHPWTQPSTHQLQPPTYRAPYPKYFPYAHLPLDTMTEEDLPPRSSAVPGPPMGLYYPRNPMAKTAPRPTKSAKGPYIRLALKSNEHSTPKPSVKATPKPNVQTSSKPALHFKLHRGERGRREALKATGIQQDRTPRSQEGRTEQHKREDLDVELDMYREKNPESTRVPSPTVVINTKSQGPAQTEAPESSKADQNSQFFYMLEPGVGDSESVTQSKLFEQESPSSLAAPQEKNSTDVIKLPRFAEFYSTAIPNRADALSPRLVMPMLRRETDDGYSYFVPLTSLVEEGDTLPAHPSTAAESSMLPEDERVWSPLSFDLMTPTSSTVGDWDYLGEVDGEGFFSDEEERSGWEGVREV